MERSFDKEMGGVAPPGQHESACGRENNSHKISQE